MGGLLLRFIISLYTSAASAVIILVGFTILFNELFIFKLLLNLITIDEQDLRYITRT